MERWIGGFYEFAYALLRFVSGAMFAMHGAQKVFGVLGKEKADLTTQIGIGGIIELVTGIAIAAGFQAGCAAFLACGTMAVAYFQFHQPDGLLPIQNKGEMAVLYCFVFLLIATKGNGIASIGGPRKNG